MSRDVGEGVLPAVAEPPDVSVVARYRWLGRAWQAAFVLLVLVIAVLAWMPGREMPMQNLSDKINHFAAFTVLGWAAWRAFPSRRVTAFVGLFAFGVLIELVQSQLPTRSAELADLGADAAGLLLAGVLGWATNRR